MPVSDPIGDMLTRIRNANMALHETVELDASKIKVEICRILKEEGYIEDYEVIEAKPQNRLRIKLKYGAKQGKTRERAITNLRRVSKPGLHVYRKAKDLKPVYFGFGTAIVSTSRGVMTDKQARRLGLGGEVLAEVW
jgi:small subunit ribosomal protein S8